MRPRTTAAVLLLVQCLAHDTTALANARFTGEQGVRGVRTRLAAGYQHTCAILDDGTVDCWGQNGFGQLGDSSRTDRLSPVPVCWGDNAFGQFATGDTAGSNLAVVAALDIFGGQPTLLTLTGGGGHACGIFVDGRVTCAGLDDALQLGRRAAAGYDYDTSSLPVPGVANAIEIAAGGKHTCAAIVDGTIRCWGDNTYGQHGDGITGQVGVDSVAGIAGTFLGRGVTAGNQFPCGRRGTGAAACWGAGGNGQLGNAASVSSLNPVAVSGLANAIAATAGGAHACALDATGQARCWGRNARGELGDGTTTASSQPVVVHTDQASPFITSFTAIAAARDHTCAIDFGGPVFCWGAGDEIGGDQDASRPSWVPLSEGAQAVAAGDTFNCALLPDGTVGCWGDNSVDQHGNGGAQIFAPGQALQVPGLFNVVAIAAGADHACAVTAFGSVLCWGGNSRGQIGNNSTTTAPFPTTVQGITDAVSISAGAFYTCAVRANGTAACWGANDAGELGVKDSVDHLTPTPVAASIFLLPTGGTTFIALSGVVAIATGTSPLSPTHEQTCGLLATGVIRCWGDNAKGEIGDGTTVNQPRPAAVNSFAANVDPAATLRHGHVAVITALIDCEAGDEAHVYVTLEQGATTGAAYERARCDGGLVRVPVRVAAFRRAEFRPGAATAHLEAIVHRGRDVVDDTHWTRDVVLSIEARGAERETEHEPGDRK